MRIAIFCLVGPPLGTLCLCFMLAFPDLSSRPATSLLSHLPEMLPALVLMAVLSYIPGFAPSLLTAQVDDYLSDKLRLNTRLLVTGLAGGLIAVAWLSFITWAMRLHFVDYLRLALVGAVPAAVCSWLSDRRARTSAALPEPKQS